MEKIIAAFHAGVRTKHGRIRILLWPWMFAAALAILVPACSAGTTPEVAYIGWDGRGQPQLFLATPAADPAQLTSLDAGVSDFAPNPGGMAFLVASPNDEGGSDLWYVEKSGRAPRQVYNCGAAECGDFVWSADGRRALFEVRDAGTRLRWLDVQSGATLPVLADEEAEAARGRLSSDESWLSYVSAPDEGIYLYNFEDGRQQLVTNEIGTPASWSPNGSELVIPRFELVITHGAQGEDHLSHSHDYSTATHLLYMDLESGVTRSISGDLYVEDSAPAWSPDGQWLAIARGVPRTNAPRQLWVMRKDGSEARAVAAEPGVNYGLPQWTPDGRALVYQRFDLDDTDGEPAIWLHDLESGETAVLAASGMQPRVLGK